MAVKDQTVAPKERINITYKPATGDAQEQTELPFKILMVGDYNGRPDDTPLEERETINVDKDNFDDVMAARNLTASISVPDTLTGEQDAMLSVELRFRSLQDFTPEGLVNQVPELKKLLELRAALTALKGPLGNKRVFAKKMTELLNDQGAQQAIMAELGLKE